MHDFIRVHKTRPIYNIPPIKVRFDYFKNSFFPSAITEWNQLDLNIRHSASLDTFKKKLLNFIRFCDNSIFGIHNPLGIKLITRLRLGLIHLHEHKFRHCFQDTSNPLCECISFSAAPTLSFLDKPSFRKVGTLMMVFYLKAKRN